MIILKLLCGDFNLVLDQELDSHNYISINNPQSRREVINMLNNQNLIDVFRFLNPNKKR